MHCIVVTDLTHQELRLRHDAIVTASADAIYSVTPKGIIATWNAAAERLYGYPAQEAIGQNIRIIFPPELDAPAELVALLGQDCSTSREGVRLTKSGGRIDVSLSVAPIRSPEGDIETFAIFARDTTERKKTDEALRVSEERLRQATRVANLGIFDTNHRTGELTCSPQLRAILGLAEGEPISPETALGLIAPEDRAALKENIARAQDPAGDGLLDSEHRIRRGSGEVRWLSVRSRTFLGREGADLRPTRTVGAVLDITQLKESEAHIQFLLREMSHRSKNLLSVIQAIVKQTARSAATADDLYASLAQRLHGLAVSHDLLVNQDWSRAALGDLVRQQLSPFVEPGRQLTLEGPAVFLKPVAVENIGLALNELATNAMKYGALSSPTGKVAVAWALDEDGDGQKLRLRWQEHDGPPVTSPNRKGFGHTILENVVVRSLDAKAEIDFAPDGFRWLLDVPATHLVRMP